MIKGIGTVHVVALAGHGIIVFEDRAVLLPRFHQQLAGLLYEVGAGFGEVVIADAQIDQEIHRSPDAPPPVIIVMKGGIVSGNRRHYIIAVELVLVEIMLLYHPLRLRLRGDLRQ